MSNEQPITPQNVKDVELDANKALQVMLNGLDVARRTGKYTFEESYFIAQALYGMQSLSDAQRKKSSDSTTTQGNSKEKVMRITWPDDFTTNDYIQVFIRHLEIGQQRGAFSFTDSALIGRAIDMFQKPQETQQPQQTEKSTPEPTPDVQEHQTVVL